MAFIAAKDGAQIYVKSVGEGPAVVLIHGWPLNADSFDDIALGLAEAGFRAVSYDRRGFGRSEQTPGGYAYDVFADDLASVIAALGLERTALVGFSMGGGEIARYLSRHGSDNISLRRVHFRRHALSAADARQPPRGALAGAGGHEGRNPRRPRRVLFRLLRGFLRGWRDHLAGFRRRAAVVVDDDHAGRAEGDARLRGRLRAHRFPPRSQGDHRPDPGHPRDADQTAPIAATGRALAKALPNARLVELEGAAHGVLASHRQEVLEELLAFLPAGP